MLVLLKATCVYCHHFRLKAAEVHRYACKLKLLSRGLVLEAQIVDDVGKDISALTHDMDMKGQGSDGSDVEGDEDEAILDRLIKKREKFVRGALHRAETSSYAETKTSTAAEERREVVKEFLKMLGRRRRCDNCGAISPSHKVEENAKVFEKSLTEKDAKYMAGRGMSRVDVNMDAIKKPLANGQAAPDTIIEMTSDIEDESGEDVMSDVEAPAKTNSKKVKAKRTQQYILSTAVRNHLRRLFNNEASILGLLFNVSGGSSKTLTADNFFLSVIAVPPTRYRPPAREGDTIRESAQNTQLSRILNTCQRIAELNIRREAESSKMSSDKYQYLHQQIDAFVQLQLDVNNLVDSNASVSMADRLSGRTLPPGIKQTLEKKEGLFRKHMMGKRVNYAARSVISPDPNIETNEIGIPPFIAQKLTFPEPVTPWNVEKLRHAVINGPGTYPGASHVEHDDGKITSLEFLSLERRTALANTLLTPDTQPRLTHGNSPLPTYLNKKVHRHLENDDILLVNRQPTLHKPSIMGHRAKVLTREKTIRLHYANCNTYNADFDGDEMNVHFPQNSLARAEAYNIANTDNQYLGPTNGNPLRGLIQDHISVAVWMTKRDTFFTRSEYQQLLYGSIQPEAGGCGGQDGRIITAPPTIIKPRPLWSGKQVISSILLNLTPTDRPGLFLDSESQVKATNWSTPGNGEKGDWRSSEEQHVIFDDGELLCGILDKAQIGPSANGMVHSVYEIYGPDVAGKLLSALGRLFTKYSQMQGLSCGMEDLRLTQQGREMRKRVLAEKAGVGREVAIEYVGLKDAYDESLFKERMEEVIRDTEKLGGLDRAMQGAASKLTSVMYRELVPVHLIKKFPKNNMQNMTESKAKGGSDNANLISSIIGIISHVNGAYSRSTVFGRGSSAYNGER
jgi:DNA-directed RNA polymerase I subunit RPA1